MNKKILIISILAVFMLAAISIVSAVNMEKSDQKKESPLYGIRTNNIINKNKFSFRENILTKFKNSRIYFIPFIKIKEETKNKDNRASCTDCLMCKATMDYRCTQDFGCTVWTCDSPTFPWISCVSPCND